VVRKVGRILNSTWDVSYPDLVGYWSLRRVVPYQGLIRRKGNLERGLKRVPPKRVDIKTIKVELTAGR
jgi:hypothetical protein